MVSPKVNSVVEESAGSAITSGIEIGGIEVVDQIADRWERLCEETRSAPFLRPEWIVAYLRAFEPGGEVVLLTASAGPRLVAVLPMVRKRCWYAGVPLVKLSGAANVHSVRFDILRTACAAGEAAIMALWKLLQRTPIWQVLELPMFPQDGACGRLMAYAAEDGCRTVTYLGQESPILRMEQDANGQLTWLGGTSRHFRHELRRFARLLEEETGHKPRLVRRTDPDRDILRRFYELEASGWKGKEGSAINCDVSTHAFYDQIAQEAADRGYFCLHSLETNGDMVAGAFSVMTKDCFFPMKIAYNEELRRGGPGQVLFNGILEECAESGIAELFFGGDKDRYKTAWTADTLPHFNGFVFRPVFLAQLAYGLRTRLLSPLGRLRRRMRERKANGKPRSGAGEAR